MSIEETSPQSTQPRMNILSQYVQDVSFSNFAAKRGASPKGKPTIGVQVTVDTAPLSSDRHRVTLTMQITAKSVDDEVFAIRLEYVGVFKLQNVPEKSVTPILEVEAPRLLFPFARRIIAELTRDGGYPPLMLDPIDFALLYRRRLAAMNADKETAAKPVEQTAE